MNADTLRWNKYGVFQELKENEVTRGCGALLGSSDICWVEWEAIVGRGLSRRVFLKGR